MPRILVLLAFALTVLWLSARRRSLGEMSFENGLPLRSSSKLGALGYEVEDVMRRIAFSGTLSFRMDGGRVAYSSKPALTRDEAQGLDNLLGQYMVRGRRVIPRHGRPRRGSL